MKCETLRFKNSCRKTKLVRLFEFSVLPHANVLRKRANLAERKMDYLKTAKTKESNGHVSPADSYFILTFVRTGLPFGRLIIFLR